MRPPTRKPAAGVMLAAQFAGGCRPGWMLGPRQRSTVMDERQSFAVLLRRYRSGDEDPKVRTGIQLTMNGLATALRNSG